MKTILAKEIEKALNNMELEVEIPITIEIPKDKNNGDYSSNIAMQLTKILKTNPREIASKIIDNINNNH